MQLQYSSRSGSPRVFPIPTESSVFGDLWLRDIKIEDGEVNLNNIPPMRGSYNAANRNISGASNVVSMSLNNLAEVSLMLNLMRTILEDASETTDHARRDALQERLNSVIRGIDSNHSAHNEALSHMLGRNYDESVLLSNLPERPPIGWIPPAEVSEINDVSTIDISTFSAASNLPPMIQERIDYILQSLGNMDYAYEQFQNFFVGDYADGFNIDTAYIPPEGRTQLEHAQTIADIMYNTALFLDEVLNQFVSLMEDFFEANPLELSDPNFGELSYNRLMFNYFVDTFIHNAATYDEGYMGSINRGASATMNVDENDPDALRQALEGLHLAFHGDYQDTGYIGVVEPHGLGGLRGIILRLISYGSGGFGDGNITTPEVPDPPEIPNPPWITNPPTDPDIDPPVLPPTTPPREDLPDIELPGRYTTEGITIQVGIHSGQQWSFEVSRINTATLAIGDGRGNTNITVQMASNESIAHSIERIDNALAFIAEERANLEFTQHHLDRDRSILNLNRVGDDIFTTLHDNNIRDIASQAAFEQMVRMDALQRASRNINNIIGVRRMNEETM